MQCFTIILMCYFVMCDAQYYSFRDNYSSTTPLPFPTCKADDINCLRRGLRTFFFLMDSGHLGMKPVDPLWVNSVAVSLPEEQLSFLMRNINVTGARWTRLSDRKFNLVGGKSGVLFISDLHVAGEITMETNNRMEPYFAHITIDIQDVESNITYAWSGQRGVDNEDYILIGAPRIAIRNTRTPTFFTQPLTDDDGAYAINQMLKLRQSVLDLITNEITIAVIHSIVDNFRLFASKIPVKYYYEYNKK